MQAPFGHGMSEAEPAERIGRSPFRWAPSKAELRAGVKLNQDGSVRGDSGHNPLFNKLRSYPQAWHRYARGEKAD